MQFGLAMRARSVQAAFGKRSGFWDDVFMDNHDVSGSSPSGNAQADEGISCGVCKHSLSTKEYSDKVACLKTLEYHDRDNFSASCEFAERKRSR
jgi:uncharacterized CHY-type Zn-finger protein